MNPEHTHTHTRTHTLSVSLYANCKLFVNSQSLCYFPGLLENRGPFTTALRARLQPGRHQPRYLVSEFPTAPLEISTHTHQIFLSKHKTHMPHSIF